MNVKALLLRVGIDKGTDGALGPIFKDGTFEYIPISESTSNSKETRTYANTRGKSGEFLSTYLPFRIADRIMHFDPEFTTFTYGDPTVKRSYLLKLQEGDLLVFYAGLSPWNNKKYKAGLYIIGYFLVEKVIDFNLLNNNKVKQVRKRYSNNAHLKRRSDFQDLVIVVGNKKKSKLLTKTILISQSKIGKGSKLYYAVSRKFEKLLGISGAIQRSVPPRFIFGEKALRNLKRVLGMAMG